MLSVNYLLSLTCLSLALTLGAVQRTEARDASVVIVTFRGCEEACEGFRARMAEYPGTNEQTVEVIDIARDQALLPGILEDLRADPPALVVTWGTAVTEGLVGSIPELGAETRLGDIPAMFMIVADPVGSEIIESYDATGRPMVTGVRNRVPEDAQLRAMLDYFQPAILGLVSHPYEQNSIQNADAVNDIAETLGFSTVTANYKIGADALVDPAQIPQVIAELKDEGAEAIYIGSSSFTLEHGVAFTEAAVAAGLPVFTAYEEMVREGQALMSVAAPYEAIGRLAADRAAMILFEGADPGAMPVVGLDTYTIIINMAAARDLSLFPPMNLIGLAEVVQ